MSSLIKIRNVLHGLDILLNEHEQLVIDTVCNLTAVSISNMPDKQSRTESVAGLPKNLAPDIKREILKIFEMRRQNPTSGTHQPDER